MLLKLCVSRTDWGKEVILLKHMCIYLTDQFQLAFKIFFLNNFCLSLYTTQT